MALLVANSLARRRCRSECRDCGAAGRVGARNRGVATDTPLGRRSATSASVAGELPSVACHARRAGFYLGKSTVCAPRRHVTFDGSHWMIRRGQSAQPGQIRCGPSSWCGPAGIFAALRLAEAGACPGSERGDGVERRHYTVRDFWRHGKLDHESNVVFGEGGAGVLRR